MKNNNKIEKKKYFYSKSNKAFYEVNEKKFLKDILNPTSKNTKYYQPPPDNKITDYQIGRILLQTHQIISILNNLGFNLKGKKFLDVGCGNGMIPRLISSLTEIKYSWGIDPFLDGEHTTSWPKHNQYKVFLKIINFIKKYNYLDYKTYKSFLTYENHTIHPNKIKTKNKKNYHYSFRQLSGLKLDKLNLKFDIIYLKSIEHFNNWDLLFKKLSSSTKKGGLVIFKHRSFFSYLGAHRYASTGIPWGHVILGENEYKNYVNKFHNERSDEMIRFYYKGLNYPRTTVNELIQVATKHSFLIKFISIEPPHYRNKTIKFIKDIKDFWKNIRKQHPTVSSEEILSGIYHIVIEKI